MRQARYIEASGCLRHHSREAQRRDVISVARHDAVRLDRTHWNEDDVTAFQLPHHLNFAQAGRGLSVQITHLGERRIAHRQQEAYSNSRSEP